MKTKNVYSFRLGQHDIDLIDSVEVNRNWSWRNPTRTEKLEQILKEYREFKISFPTKPEKQVK